MECYSLIKNFAHEMPCESCQEIAAKEGHIDF